MFHVRKVTLIELLDGRLPEGRAARVREHLKGCATCRRKLEGLEWTLKALAPCGEQGAMAPRPEGGAPCRDVSELHRYYRNLLPPDEAAEVRAHLKRCGACSHLLAGFVEEQLVEAAEEAWPEAQRAPAVRPLFRPGFALGLSGAAAAFALAALLVWQGAGPPDYAFQVVAQKAAPVRAGTTFPLLPGSVLQAGDRFRIRFTAGDDLYLYILLYTSEGKAEVLFPGPEIDMAHELRGGHVYEIPPGGFWPLDEKTGVETLFLVATRRPLEGVERVPADLERVLAPLPPGPDRVRAAEDFLRESFGNVRTFPIDHQ